MACWPPTCRHVGKMSRMLGIGPTHYQLLSAQPFQTTLHVMPERHPQTCLLILLDIKEIIKVFPKITLKCHNLAWEGWKKGISYVNMHTCTLFFKIDSCLHQSNGSTCLGYGRAVMQQHISWHMTQPQIQLGHWQHCDVSWFSAEVVGIIETCTNMLRTFPTKVPEILTKSSPVQALEKTEHIE